MGVGGEEGVSRRGSVGGVGERFGAEFQDGIDRGATGVHLERIGEHDKNDDGGFADCRAQRRSICFFLGVVSLE